MLGVIKDLNTILNAMDSTKEYLGRRLLHCKDFSAGDYIAAMSNINYAERGIYDAMTNICKIMADEKEKKSMEGVPMKEEVDSGGCEED